MNYMILNLNFITPYFFFELYHIIIIYNYCIIFLYTVHHYKNNFSLHSMVTFQGLVLLQKKAVPRKPATWSSACPEWSTSQATKKRWRLSGIGWFMMSFISNKIYFSDYTMIISHYARYYHYHGWWLCHCWWLVCLQSFYKPSNW